MSRILYDNMSIDQKLDHIEWCVKDAKHLCETKKIFEAEILDFFDYWIPDLIKIIRELKNEAT